MESSFASIFFLSRESDLAFEVVWSRRQFGTQALDRGALDQNVFLGFDGARNRKFCITVEQIS
jgi:hypothetical protein